MKSLERVMLFDSNETFIADLDTNTIVTTEIEGLDGESRLIFDYPLEQSDVELITEGCFIAINDLDGTDEEYLLYEIVTLTQDDVALKAECTHDYYNLAKGEIVTWDTTSENADMPLGTTLANERYQLGIVQINRLLTRDRKNVNPLESLRYIEKEWGGELRFRITITLDYQINRYVDHLTRRGVFVGNRFEFGHNMSEFSHVIETAHIVTASYGFGQTPQAVEGQPEPEPITFADVEWAIANGDPTDKPLGQIWVGDDVARLAYGRADGMGGKKHKFMKYDIGQSETPEGLLWESWRQVQMSNFPLVNMAAKVVDLGSINPNFSHERARLGDDHFIIADVKGKPVELKSRIIKFTRRRQNPTENEVELGNFLPTASNQIIDISKKVDLIEKRQGEPTATLPDTTSPIDASRIQGILDTINVEVRSSLGYVYQDENGILLLNAPKDANPTKAMLLSGGAFFLANSKLVDGSWDWRGFGDGDGFMADEIVGGRIKTDLVEIFGNANFKWNGNNIYITDPTNSLKQIRIGLYNGTDYGIGFTTDGGTTWQNALDFDGLTISVSNVDGLAAELQTRDDETAAALQRAIDAETAAKDYADQQIALTNQEVADVNSSVGDLNTYVDGAFKDGVFEATEAIAIQKYLNVIDTEKSDVDNRFTAVYNDAQLTGTPKTNLDTAKTAFNLAHTNLTNSINAAVLDGKTTAAEKTDVNTKFASFRTAIQTLATRFEEALRAIEQAKATQALTDAKADTTAKIATVNQTITNLNTYVDGAFEDGVIEAAEAKAIEKYLNSLNAEKGDIDNRYTIAYADASLVGTPKTNLATAKTAYNTAHANLLTSINTAITDGKTTTAEKADVDSKFGLYRTALNTFATRFEEAIRAIEQAKATAAETAAKADTTAKIATVNQTITNLNTYVDGAFEDGVIEQAESKAIEKYLNSLNTEKLDVDNRYSVIYADASLTGTPKTNLATSKTAYDTAHANLIASINTAIADGKTTALEKADVDSKFTSYKNALGTLATRLEEATRAIEQAKATAAEVAAKADTTAKIATVNQTITNLNTYVDGAFEDGIIEMAEAKAIEKYLNSLNTEKLDVDNRYTIIYADASLTGTPKTNLLAAKTAYGTAHTNLLSSINTAITDGKTTTTEKADVDSKFTAYKTALGTLATRFEEAIRAIEQAKATAAETAAKADTTAKIATVNQSIANVSQDVTDLNTYVDGAFEDGVIQIAEAKAIGAYVNSLNTEKNDLDNRYNAIYAEANLSGTPKTNLSTAKTAYNTSHTNLINSINTAIADGKTTTTEKADVDTKFTAYKTALATLSTRFEEAIQAIEQAKIAAIKVGGRNLYPNSGLFRNLDNWTSATLSEENGVPILVNAGTITNTADVPLLPNTEYVFSAKMKLSVDFPVTSSTPNHTYVRYAGDTAYSALEGSMVLEGGNRTMLANQWEIITLKFKTKADPLKVPMFKFHAYTGATVATKYVEWVMLEEGNMRSGWSPSVEDTEQRFTFIETDIDDVLFQITDDQIISKVTGSTTFTNALDEKANADIADNLATKEELANGVSDAKGYADEVIGNFDTSTFVTESELIQTKTDFDFQISKSSGVNLLKNSVGFADLNEWSSSMGAAHYVVTQANDELSRLGFGSGFYFPPLVAGNNRTIWQSVAVTAGVPYTLSCVVNKRNVSSSANSDGRLMIDLLTSNDVSIARIDILSAQITNGYELKTLTVIPTEGVLKVRAYAYGLVDATITGLMLNLGDVALQWTMAHGEVYNSNVQFDINGIRVLSSAYNGYTQITPEEFAGYAEVPNASNVLEMQKVFTVNKDVTEMKKTKVEDEFTMPPIKIVTVTSASYTGWAFIADQ